MQRNVFIAFFFEALALLEYLYGVCGRGGERERGELRQIDFATILEGDLSLLFHL